MTLDNGEAVRRPEMPDVLRDKVVMVCGVGPDLGRALAVRSAEAGADVVVAARSEERLRSVAAEVAALGRRALPVVCDVADSEAQQALADAATTEFGRVDVLMNSAFVQPPQEPLLEVDLDQMREWTDINVLASVGLVQKLAKSLVHARGSVVLINSVVLRNRAPGFGAYRMHKYALLAAARSLSMELGPQGVRVNSVAPGYIWSQKVQGHFTRRAEQTGLTSSRSTTRSRPTSTSDGSPPPTRSPTRPCSSPPTSRVASPASAST